MPEEFFEKGFRLGDPRFHQALVDFGRQTV
jgi:hypothetical protein